MDGCSSHTKEYTQKELLKDNITPIYFHPNSSHVVQPADGQIFQGYKPEVARKASALDFNHSLGAPDQKHFDLAISLEAHRKAITPTVIQAAFKTRGIFPFDKAVIMANAHRACPQDTFVSAPQDIHTSLIMKDAITELSACFKLQPKLDRKVIEGINKPEKLEDLAKWKRAAPARKETPAHPPVQKKQKIVEIKEDSSESEPEPSDDEDAEPDMDFFVPRLVRSVSADSCSHCGHHRKLGTVPLACFDCSKYWLCSPCRTNTNALAEHFKTCENAPADAGHRSLRARS